MKKILIIVLAILVAGGVYYFTQSDDLRRQSNAANESNVQMVNPDEFDELANQSEIFVLDVHTPEQTHITGTDEVIPYNQLEENRNSLPEEKSTPILVYCRSGSMSREAAQTLSNMGYTTIYDLDGGIQAYREQRVDVSIQPDTQDLGTVIYGDVATTTFTLTNNTPQPLTITSVSTSCSCTSAEVEKESLEPYDSTSVTVSFDPAVHKDDTDLGDIVRTIYIETDNPNFERVTAEITAHVVKN